MVLFVDRNNGETEYQDALLRLLLVLIRMDMPLLLRFHAENVA